MTSTPPDPKAVIEKCFQDLANNVAPELILPPLRDIEALVAGDPPLKARFLRARAIATNRLGGFAGEALGDLYEARRLLEENNDPRELAEVCRAIALVHNWQGDARSTALALLRAVAEASTVEDRISVALSLIEGGRLELGIGHPREAQALIARAIEIAHEALPRREFQRAWVNKLQASVAAGLIEEARAQRDGMGSALADALPRLHLLANLESARIDRQLGNHDAARAALERAVSFAPEDREKFEHVEIAEVRAELALAEGDAATADKLLHEVIARFAGDDLAQREVVARMLHAKALEALNRPDEVERTLAAALRRALARGLSGYADQVRSRIAEQGGVEGAGLATEASAGLSYPDSTQRFVRRRPLGGGGFGAVVRAYDLELGFEVALKRSVLKDIYDPSARDRLLEAARTEVAAASRINHPGIARIFGLLTEPDGDALLIEEFVEGPTLRGVMAKAIEPARLFDLLSRIAFSLAAVHAADVIHRDLKPDNVILRAGDAPVLVDFGIALLDRNRKHMAKGGTPFYMSPEQARGRNVDARADLYSLGVTAYESLIGERPEAQTSSPFSIVTSLGRVREVRRELDSVGVEPEAAGLVASLLSPHPHWRPPNAATVGTLFAEASKRASHQA